MRTTIIIGSILALVGVASVAQARDSYKASDRDTARVHREVSDEAASGRTDPRAETGRASATTKPASAGASRAKCMTKPTRSGIIVNAATAIFPALPAGQASPRSRRHRAAGFGGLLPPWARDY